MTISAMHVPPLAYVINIIGAILLMVLGLYSIFDPRKAIELMGRNNPLIENTPEDSWWQRHFVLLRISGVIFIVVSVATVVSTVRSLFS
jgi:hypothetical protein